MLIALMFLILINLMWKTMNIWVQAKQHGYMDMAKWNTCKLSELPFDVSGMPVYVGFDMSVKIDLTSVAFIVPYKDNDDIVKYLLWSHTFIPNREKLRERCAVDKCLMMRGNAINGLRCIMNS